ncbi:MAG: GNAT family N-acetyltransferase [Pseudomonadota bacterium]
MTVRAITEADLDWVLALNTAFETELSPLDRDGLARLVGVAAHTFAADPQAAFLLVMDQDADYDSPNFLWHRARFERFLYVDRIAVSANHRRKGLAQALYAALFDAARADGHTHVVCEVNSDPPNPQSDAFHEALGFYRIGEEHLPDRGKTVRYLACEL